MKKLSIIKSLSVAIAILLLVTGLCGFFGYGQGINSYFYNLVALIVGFFYDLSLALILLVIAFEIIDYSKKYHLLSHILIVIGTILLLTNIHILKVFLRHEATQMYNLVVIINEFLEKISIGITLIFVCFTKNYSKNTKKY